MPMPAGVNANSYDVIVNAVLDLRIPEIAKINGKTLTEMQQIDYMTTEFSALNI